MGSCLAGWLSGWMFGLVGRGRAGGRLETPLPPLRREKRGRERQRGGAGREGRDWARGQEGAGCEESGQEGTEVPVASVCMEPVHLHRLWA
eukprot:scaffold274169_cov31-Tisochrysis_lutea.AAC.2